jgi:hypothetical protein
VHLFWFTAGERVIHPAEVGAKRDVETGFFENFALRGFGQSFARVNFSFGQRDIFVLGSMNKQDTHFAVDDFPAHSTTGVYGV